MIFGLLKQSSPVDEQTTLWLLEVYGWILAHCDGPFFFDETRLILPSNTDFPGHADSIHGMAELVFGHVCRHAGMAQWPVSLARPETCGLTQWPALRVTGRLRGDSSAVAAENLGDLIELAYDPELVGNPEPLVASLAHSLAAVLVATPQAELPGGRENWPFVAEVMAVAMGFGVMLANSAKTMQVRSCASCGPASNRTSFLPEFDITYALALFCALKGIPARDVTPHLKAHLRGVFKSALKDAANRQPQLSAIKQLPSASIG